MKFYDCCDEHTEISCYMLIHIDTLKTFAKIRTCFKSSPNLPEAQQILAMSHLTTWRLNN